MPPIRVAVTATALVLVPVPAAACDTGPWDIPFAEGSSALSDDAREIAGSAAAWLPRLAREGIVAQIKLTASRTSPSTPEPAALSRRRAEAVRAYIESLGVPPSRIYAIVAETPSTRVRPARGPLMASAPVSLVAFPEAVRTVTVELTRGCGG